MKRLMIGLAIAAMAATPTLAQTYTYYDNGQHYVAADVSTETYAPMAYAPTAIGYQAYAYAPAPEVAYGPPPVYNNGDSYQGTDPDPFIRLQLRREAPHEFGGE